MPTYYDAGYAKKKTQSHLTSHLPPQANLLAAASHMRDMFDNKRFLYGIAGGLATLCFGYRRDIPNLHIVYDDKDYNRIKKRLGSDKRIAIPDDMNPLFPFKVLVHTGPAFRDPGCSQTATIEVNMIPPGSCGSPPSGTLSSNVVLKSYKKDGHLNTYKVLNEISLVRTMLFLCTVRDLTWNPRADILFLCLNYGDELQVTWANLDKKAIQLNFLGTAFLIRLPREHQRICYQVLLGKEPPPAMSITPPTLQYGHERAVSDYAPPKPRINPRLSDPGIGKQTLPALLGPPNMWPNHSARKESVVTTSVSTESSTRHANVQSEILAPKRISYSRYRLANSRKTPSSSPSGDRPARLPNIYHESSQHEMVAGESVSRPIPATVNYVPVTAMNSQALEQTTSTQKKEPRLKHQKGKIPWHNPPAEPTELSQEAGEPKTFPNGNSIGLSEIYYTTQHSLIFPNRAAEAAVGSISSRHNFLKLEALSHENGESNHYLTKVEVCLHPEDRTVSGSNKSSEFLASEPKQKQHAVLHDGIPISLAAGRSTTQFSGSRNSGNIILPEQLLHYKETNQSPRYSRYYSQPSAFESNFPSPEFAPVPLNTYKAYKPENPLHSPPLTPPIDGRERSDNVETPKNINDSRPYVPVQAFEQGSNNTSQDSNRLAQDYQAELPDYEDGYGTKADGAHHYLNHYPSDENDNA